MKRSLILFLTALVFHFFNSNISGQSQIPTNNKANQIVKRVSLILDNELDSLNLNIGSPVYLRIFKQSKELEVWIKNQNIYQLFKTYPVCTYGYGTIGPKLSEGDGQAPEGFYSVGHSTLNPYSIFHLSIGVGYPNAYDRALNRTGSAIMIHGNCVSIGCFAMTDSIIEEIYTLVYRAISNGQQNLRIDIFPFRITEENLEEHSDSEWYDFWVNLKEGYDLFENNKFPPRVRVRNNRYIF